MWDDEYKITFEENTIHDYERVMLTSGDCDYLIPMTFIGENGKETAYYNCSGFAALSTYSIEKTDDALFVLEKVLLILEHVVEYLISPAKVTLNDKKVFYRQESGQIKIAYVPMTDEAVSLRRNLLKFIALLKADIKDGNGGYLDKIARLIHYGNYRTGEVISQIGMLRRELYSKTSASS